MSLAVDEKLSAAEFATSLVATEVFGLPCLAYAEDGNLYIQIFGKNEQRTITWNELSRPVQRRIRWKIDDEILRRETLNDNIFIKRFRGQLVSGTLVSKKPDGSWLVNILLETGVSYTEHHAFYPVKNQPSKEQANYAPGQVCRFEITSIIPVKTQSVTQVRIQLSRISTTFPLLIANFVNREAAQKADLRVFKRVPGIITKFLASRALPKKMVSRLASELGEIIIFNRSSKKKRNPQRKTACQIIK